jgi:hypothetical protein
MNDKEVEMLALSLEGRIVDGWTFTYEYPGIYKFSKRGISVCCTPDYDAPNVVSLQIDSEDGDTQDGWDVPYEGSMDADAFCALMQPHLQKTQELYGFGNGVDVTIDGFNARPPFRGNWNGRPGISQDYLKTSSPTGPRVVVHRWTDSTAVEVRALVGDGRDSHSFKELLKLQNDDPTVSDLQSMMNQAATSLK